MLQVKKSRSCGISPIFFQCYFTFQWGEGCFSVGWEASFSSEGEQGRYWFFLMGGGGFKNNNNRMMNAPTIGNPAPGEGLDEAPKIHYCTNK